jgi:hypothetical protein
MLLLDVAPSAFPCGLGGPQASVVLGVAEAGPCLCKNADDLCRSLLLSAWEPAFEREQSLLLEVSGWD